MQTILVPTNFSEIAQNAVNYAIELAKLQQSKLVLFHVYFSAGMDAESKYSLPKDEIGLENLRKLEIIRKKIYKRYGNEIDVECICRCGFPLEEIKHYVEENDVELIVMGMEGADFLTEKLIGNITTNLINTVKCPILSIDINVKFKNIQKILLACDQLETTNKLLLDPLKVFAKIYKSHIYLVNVTLEVETSQAVSKTISGFRHEHTLDEFEHSIHYIKNKNALKGINDFVDEMQIDMVVTLPKTHTYLQMLFREPFTKKMAFHTRIPLLVLHDEYHLKE